MVLDVIRGYLETFKVIQRFASAVETEVSVPCAWPMTSQIEPSITTLFFVIKRSSLNPGKTADKVM